MCKYLIDEICTNADCPYVADFCPVTQDDSICRHRNGERLVTIEEAQSVICKSILNTSKRIN